MRFFYKHWEKLALVVFLVAVCAWGLWLYFRVGSLKEDVARYDMAHVEMVGDELSEVTREDFTADRLVYEPRREWGELELATRTSIVRPQSLIACINQYCGFWLPIDTDICPNCGSDQGDLGFAFDIDDTRPDDVLLPLERRLYLANISRQTFGAVLSRLTVIPGQPPEEWDLQFQVREADGRTRTRFTKKNGALRVDGTSYRVAEVEHIEDTVFNPRINAEETIDRSRVVLKGPEEQSIELVRGERKDIGEYRIQMVLLDPRTQQVVRRFNATSNQVLPLRDVDGSRHRFEVEVRRDNQVYLRNVEDEQADEFRLRSISQRPAQTRPEPTPDPDYDMPFEPDMFDQPW